MADVSQELQTTIRKMRSIWENLEKVFQSHLTLHDHTGIFILPDGVKLLPDVNIHQSDCCVFWYSNRDRCEDHCNFGAKRRAAGEKSAFVSSCFCGVTEVVMPLFSENIHSATIFAGMYRKKDFDLSAFPSSYRKLYAQLPEWHDELTEHLETLLTAAGYSLLMLAENLRRNYATEQGRVGEIRKFFRTRYAENIGVADLAKTLELSESRTLHLLLAEFHQGFSRLLTKERLKHVTQLLIESDLPLHKIARMTGFSNEYYLSTVFKKYYGISPGQKRKIRQ